MITSSKGIKEILDRLEELDRLYTKLSGQLENQVPCHPTQRIVIRGLPRGIRELQYLLFLQGQGIKFPAWLVLELDDRRRRAMKDWKQREIVSNLVTELLYNDRFLQGRAVPQALQSLEKIRVYLNLPKKPKKTSRVRGYRDHGSMSDQSTRARRSANAQPDPEKVLDTFYEERSKDFLLASQILEMESQGISSEEIQALLDAGEISLQSSSVDSILLPSNLKELLLQAGVEVQPEETPLEALRRSRRPSQPRRETKEVSPYSVEKYLEEELRPSKVSGSNPSRFNQQGVKKIVLTETSAEESKRRKD